MEAGQAGASWGTGRGTGGGRDQWARDTRSAGREDMKDELGETMDAFVPPSNVKLIPAHQHVF